MGLRGPVPVPTAVNKLRGFPGHRPVNHREPQPVAKAPACPEYVRSDPAARSEWKRLLPILKRMRVLTEADGLTLASLCVTHSHLLLNLEKMRELNAKGGTGIGGMVYATKNGYLAINQIYSNVQTCMKQELEFCRELGLTPSARSRIQVAPQKPTAQDDPWAKL